MRRDADQNLITYMPLHGVFDMAVRPGRKHPSFRAHRVLPIFRQPSGLRRKSQ